MNREVIKEAKARVITLFAYAKHKKNMAKIKSKLSDLYDRTYEYKGGKRRKLTKSRKIKLGKDIIRKHTKNKININKDIDVQMKLDNDNQRTN